MRSSQLRRRSNRKAHARTSRALLILDEDYTSTPSISLVWYGGVGDGAVETMRDFVQNGTVTFRVDSGEVNVVHTTATLLQAEELYPGP